jgi:hypothetical protein
MYLQCYILLWMIRSCFTWTVTIYSTIPLVPSDFDRNSQRGNCLEAWLKYWQLLTQTFERKKGDVSNLWCSFVVLLVGGNSNYYWVLYICSQPVRYSGTRGVQSPGRPSSLKYSRPAGHLRSSSVAWPAIFAQVQSAGRPSSLKFSRGAGHLRSSLVCWTREFLVNGVTLHSRVVNLHHSRPSPFAVLRIPISLLAEKLFW